MTTLKPASAETLKGAKKSKMPTIYIIQKGVAQDVKRTCLVPLFEGLKHLKVNLIEGDDTGKALSQADITVLFSYDKDLLHQAWENGVVPITGQFAGEITDYNPNSESGNAFVYENTNHWEIFAAIVRAIETYKFPYDWKFIVRSCKKTVSA